jgi:hypothetical protein
MNLYIKETKYWLTSEETLKDSAKFFNCSSTTFLNRSIRTLSRLVNYFDFDHLNIEYPCLPNHRGTHGRFRNGKKYKDYWLKVIEDYENGATAYTFNVPNVLKKADIKGKKVSDLYVWELEALMKEWIKEAFKLAN